MVKHFEAFYSFSAMFHILKIKMEGMVALYMGPAPQIQEICEGHLGFTDTSINFRVNATVITQTTSNVRKAIKQI